MQVREDGAAKVARKVFDAFVETELSRMSLFATVTPKQLKQVIPLFSLEERDAGELLFNQGSPGDKVYILMHGSVQIRKGSLVLSTLHAEQGQAAATDLGLPIFGEMAILDRSPRIAAAMAVSDCKLLVLPGEQFAACMLIVPDIKARLRRVTVVRKTANAHGDLARSAGARAANAEAARDSMRDKRREGPGVIAQKCMHSCMSST